VSLRAILDTSAIRAYAAGSIAVGELIGEFSDEGTAFGVPALCLVEAATGAAEHARSLLAVLTEHPHAELLPLDPAQWQRIAAAAGLLGSVSRACAALPVALGQADYAVTAEPDAYPGIDTIGI
jgi:hypothetical protein